MAVLMADQRCLELFVKIFFGYCNTQQAIIRDQYLVLIKLFLKGYINHQPFKSLTRGNTLSLIGVRFNILTQFFLNETFVLLVITIYDQNLAHLALLQWTSVYSPTLRVGELSISLIKIWTYLLRKINCHQWTEFEPRTTLL